MGQTHNLTLQNKPQAMPTITRITATIEATQTVAWPHFAGSTLRGAFGRALRHAACITGQDKCDDCPLRNSCAYGVVFEPAPAAKALHPSFQNGLPRYLVQPPPLGACKLNKGQRQVFKIILLPGTQAHHTLVMHILRAAVEIQLIQPGLFKLTELKVSEEQLVPLLSPDIENASAHLTQPRSQMTLRWLSPLRLQHQGKPVFKSHVLDASLLIRALLLRHLQWCQLTQQVPLNTQLFIIAASVCRLNTNNLRWHDIDRFSSTQNEKLPMGGLMGSAELEGPASALQILLPLLQLGERLHIGKEIVMGMGHYQLSAMQNG
jgi:hypothetical protein